MRIIETLKAIWTSLKETVNERRNFTGLLYHFGYRLRWNIRPIWGIAGTVPLDVDVELSNGCNFRCTMCQQSTEWLKKKDEKFMDWETLRLVVKQCVQIGVPSMKVNWRGESTLDPEYAEKIKYIKDSGIHEVQMNTNASKLDKEAIDKLMHSGLDRIIFSCDGISKETYNTIRRGGDYDRFFAAVKLFKERRDEADKHRKKRRGLPRIRINASIQEANKHEIPLFKKEFKGLCDEIRYNTVYNPMNSNKFLGKEHREVKRKGCPQIYQRLIVSVTGNVVPCCVDFKEQLVVGKTNRDSIQHIYRKKVGNVRRLHENHKGRSLPACDTCDNFALSFKSPDGKIGWQ